MTNLPETTFYKNVIIKGLKNSKAVKTINESLSFLLGFLDNSLL